MALDKGQTVGDRYRVVGLLGTGGMGAVYRAWDTRLNVPVALKEMITQPGLDATTLAQLRQQFHREATVLARLDHPHLGNVTDFFEEESNTYLVMKFVAGESLADRIGREGALSEAQVLAWSRQLLEALDYCHSRGIIHRDVKPQNVIITPEGQPVLVDFGLVKLWDPRDPQTQTAIRGMGTPEYAAPEQYSAQTGHTDPRTDLYSLGSTMYHALTGQAPLTATDRIADPDQFTPLRKLNPRVSARTEAAVLRAVELARAKRFQNAGAMAAALADEEAPSPVRPALPKRQRTKVLPDARRVAPKHQPAKVMPSAKPIPPRRRRTKVIPQVQAAASTRRGPLPVWAWALLGTLVVLAIVVGALPLFRRASVVRIPVRPILFTSNRDGEQEIYQLTSDGAVRVTYTPSGGSWSPILGPDGPILFTSNRDGKREVYRLASEGATARLTHTPGSGESWSPVPVSDGSVLLTSNRDGKREIYQLSGDALSRVTYSPGDGESWAPAIAPDGSILFTSNRSGKREIYHLTGAGDLVQTTHTPGEGESWSPVFAHDSSILFTSNRDGKQEIYHLSNEMEVNRVTYTPGNGESWSPSLTQDGSILFTSNRDGKQEIYHLTGEEKVVQVTYTPGDGESWSPVR